MKLWVSTEPPWVKETVFAIKEQKCNVDIKAKVRRLCTLD